MALSDKINGKAETNTLIDPSWIYTRDVKEAIKELKKHNESNFLIYEVFGKELFE